MENGFLDNFLLPDGAAEAIKRAGVSSQKLGDGVEMFNFGHDKGVAYRFFVHQLRNEAKSKIAGISIPDSIEMIEWMPDRFQKPTERVKRLPEELLAFDEDGVCIGGQYKQAYDAWKAGLKAPGLSLIKWGVLSDGEIFTLQEMKVYTVEQFASLPRSKFDRLPKEFLDAFEQAIEYCNGKTGRDAAAAASAQVLELQKQNADLAERLAKLEAKPAKRKGNGNRRAVVVAGEIKEEE